MNNFSATAADIFASKMAKAGIERSDLEVHDYVMLANSDARVLLKFEQRLGTPNAQAVAGFIRARFGNEIQAQISTARVHPAQSAVSVIVSPQRVTRPIEDIEALAMKEVVANTVYLDSTIRQNWKVASHPDTGSKFLVLQREENVEQLLKASRARVTTASFTGNSNMAVGFVLPETGDYIEFYADNGLRQGEVSRIGKSEITVSEDDGATHVIDFPSVTRILQKNTKSQNAIDEQLIADLTPTMGSPELAEKLVKEQRNLRRS